MQHAPQLLLTSPRSPRGSSPPHRPASPPDGAGLAPPQPRPGPPGTPVAGRMPRLRTVVESAAFRNILVDEMDLLHSRAATLIQANWRGHQLRRKLLSQMTAARAIQEAWRRFSTRRLLRSSRLVAKKVSEEEGDIPYHPPQQVRFQHPEELPPGHRPSTVNRETQFPSLDSLAPEPGLQPPCAAGAPRMAFLPHQTVAVSPDAKWQPCMLTKTIRSACLVRHVEGDTVKSKHVTARANKAGAPEPPPPGREGQASPRPPKTHLDVEILKVPVHACRVPTTTKCPPKTCPGVPIAKSPAPTGPACTVARAPPPTCPLATVLVTKTPPQPYPVPALAKPQAQMSLAAPLTCAALQTRAAVTTIKGLPQPRPAATTTKAPPHTCPMAKPSPQTRLGTATARCPPQPCLAAASSKTSTQTCPGSGTKPPRLAAMITKTPAQIRSVATVLKTLCQVPPATGTLRAPPQTGAAAEAPNASSHAHLSVAKTKVTVNTKQVTGTVRVASQAYLAEGKGRRVHQPHPDTGAPKPTKAPLEAEKIKICPPKQGRRETESKTNMAVETIEVSSWAKVAEDKNKTLSQAQQRTEVTKVRSKVLVQTPGAPARAQGAVLLTGTSGHVLPCAKQRQVPPQAAMATCSARATSQAHVSAELVLPKGHVDPCPPGALAPSPLAAHLMKVSSQLRAPQPAKALSSATSRAHPLTELTVVLPEGHLPTCPTSPPRPQLVTSASKILSQPCPPAEPARALSQARVAACPTALARSQLATHLMKVSSQLYRATERTETPSQPCLAPCPAKATSQICAPAKLSRAPSLAHLVTCLSKAQSQAELVTETARCLFATDLGTKTQSQTLLTKPKASAHSCQHLGALGPASRAKPDNRVAQPRPYCHTQGQATQDAPGVLVPLLAPAEHPMRNVESWGDSVTSQVPPPVPSHAVLCQEELVASQIAALCAELAAVLASQEDLRTLLTRALSQGEVRAALNQALAKEALGATVAKALPHGLLSMVLVKALTWGDLGTTLSRALSRGELARVVQGKLADVLSRALSDEERAALCQALCQGELGAIVSQSLSQVAQRTTATVPKATSRTGGSRMTVPAPIEAGCRGCPAGTQGPVLGAMRPQCAKVRGSWVAAWGDRATGQLAALLQGMGDGATVEGLPCLLLSPGGDLLTVRTLTSTYRCPIAMDRGPVPSWKMGPSGVFYPDLYLSPEIQKGQVRLTPGSGRSAAGLSPMAGGEGPHLPEPPLFPPPPGPWQPLIANGAGPSSHQPSVACGPAPSSCPPSVASRVAPRPWMSPGAGGVALGKLPGKAGGGKGPPSRQAPSPCQGATCWCQNLRVSKVSLSAHHPPVARGHNQVPKATAENLRRTQVSSHKQTSLGPREATTMVTLRSLKATTRQVPKGRGDGHLLRASPNSRLAQACPQAPVPRQERIPTKASGSARPCPQEPATGHQTSLLNELVTILPQHPKNVLAKSFSPGGAACGAQESGPAPPSVLSLSSLVAMEQPPGPRAGDVCRTRPPGDAARRPQGLLDAQRRHLRPVSPRLQPQPPTTLGPMPILRHSSVASRLALSVHWDSDSDTDHSSVDLTEAMSQEPFPAGPRRSVSLDTVLLAGDPRLTPTLSQPLPAPSGSLLLSQLLGATHLNPSLSYPMMSSRVSPGPAQTSMATRVSPSLAQPSMATGGSPSLAQPSMATGVSPSLAQLSIASGVSPSLAQPSMATGMSPSFAQPSMATGVSPGLVQPSATMRLAPSLPQPAGPSGVSPGLANPSADSGVMPELAQLLMAAGEVPSSAHVSVGSGVGPGQSHLCETSGLAPGLVQKSMAGGMSPSLSHHSMGSAVSLSLSHHSMAGGVSPSLSLHSLPTGVSPSLPGQSTAPGGSPSFAQPSMITGLSSSLAQPSMATGGSPSLAQPSTITGGSPILAHQFVATEMSPSFAQPSMVTRVSPSLAQPSMTTGVSSSLPHRSMATGVSPNLAKPSMIMRLSPNLAGRSVATEVSPSLAQFSMAMGVSPGSTQPCMVTGVSPGLAQPSVASGVAPSLIQRPLSSRVASSLMHPFLSSHEIPGLSQPPGANLGALSLLPPSVVCGVGHGARGPSLVPREPWGPQCLSLGASGPGRGHPPVMSVCSGRPCPCVARTAGDTLSQPPPGVGVGSPDHPLMVAGGLSEPQNSDFHQACLRFHQLPGTGGCHPSPVTIPGPNPCGAPAACEVCGQPLGPGRSCHAWGRGLATSTSPGPRAASLALSMCHGATLASGVAGAPQRNMAASLRQSQCPVANGLAPGAPWALEAGAPLVEEGAPMATGVAQGLSPAAVPGRSGGGAAELFLCGLSPAVSPVGIPLPVTLDPQRCPVGTVGPSSHQYAGIVPQGATVGMGCGGFVPGPTDGRVTPGVAPSAVISRMALGLPPGCVIRGVGHGLSPGSTVHGVAHSLPPGTVEDVMANSLLWGTTVAGVTHGLPPGNVISGTAQTFPLEPVAGSVAHSLPLGSVAPMSTPGGDRKRPSLSVGPWAGVAAPGPSLDSVTPGTGSRAPVSPAPRRTPQGSMLIGISPRPYPGAPPAEGAPTPFQAPHSTSPTQVHPWALEASGAGRGWPQVPMVLATASQFSQDPGMASFGGIDDPTVLNPRHPNETLSQASESKGGSIKSEVLGATSWLYSGPVGTEGTHDHGALVAKAAFPEGQMPLFTEVTSSQAGGEAPVPSWSPSLAQHSRASGGAPIGHSMSASSRCHPGCHPLAAHSVLSVQTTPMQDRATNPEATGGPSALQLESMADIRLQSHPLGTVASIRALQVPQPARGSAMASPLHPGSAAGTGDPSLWMLEAVSAGSHARPVLSFPQNPASTHPQIAVPSAVPLPASGNLTQDSHKALACKKSYRSVFGSIIPQLLEGPMRTGPPSHPVQGQASPASLGGLHHPTGTSSANLMPVIHSEPGAHGGRTPRPYPKVRRVSLGYESSPSGSRRPLSEDGSHSNMHLGHRRASVTPTVSHGQSPHNIKGPEARHRASLIPTAPHGQNPHNFKGPVCSHCQALLTPAVLQGPAEAGVAGGQSWISAVPSVAVRPSGRAVAPHGTWELARGPVPRATVRSRLSGELMVSVRDTEKIIIQAVVTIQACARGYLVRRTIKVWHRWATVIQATWRGYCVRRNLAHLYRATTVIQAAWRGYCTRRDRARRLLLPEAWAKPGDRARGRSDPEHRCFLSCQPDTCSLCRSLNPGLQAPPSVVMLVGSTPRTCHTCGHTLPTRVVHGVGCSDSGQAGTKPQALCPRQPCGRNRAATAIQSAWRGFRVRCQLRQQQVAAKMLQANWRGHYTRTCLTTDALLSPGGPWDCAREALRRTSWPSRWPGV